MPDQARPPVFDGYYEGATDEGDALLFMIPSENPVITRFQATLGFVEIGPEGDRDDQHDFVAIDIPIADDGRFHYSGEYEENDHLWLGLKGVVLPDGKAKGVCIGVLKGHESYGSSGWRKWTAARNDEEEISSDAFLWRWEGN